MQEGEEGSEVARFEKPEEFQAKLQLMKEREKGWDGTSVLGVYPGVAFDEGSSLLIYSSAIGIKVASIATGQLLRVHGKPEASDYFLKLALL